MNFKNQKNRIKFWKNRLFLAIGLVIIIFIAINFFRIYRQNQAVNSEITNLSDQINALEQQNTEQKKLIEYFNSSAYIEEKARNSLGLKKEGEKIVVVNNQNANQPALAQNDAEQTPIAASNPAKWWHYFFK